jgi:(2Fe-2S) ferredoxin
MPDPVQAAVARFKPGTPSRHVFLCVGGKCASARAAQASWDHLKRRLRSPACRTWPAASCAPRRTACASAPGPIAVVYPDGVWYRDCTPANLDRIIEEHLLGRVVEELVIAVAPLGKGLE